MGSLTAPEQSPTSNCGTVYESGMKLSTNRLLGTTLLLSLLASPALPRQGEPTVGEPSVRASGALAAFDSLGPGSGRWLRERLRGWTDQRPELTGTVAEAREAMEYLSRHPSFGPKTVDTVLRRLEPRAAQAFMIGLAGTVQGEKEWAVERGQDALAALTAPLELSSLDQLVETNLVGLSGLHELNGLRILELGSLPEGKRQAIRRARLSVPAPIPGQLMQKVIRLKDLERYLNGEFQPSVGGSVAVYDQVRELHTPPQLITGLRLDYPRGFYGETELAALVFPWPPEMRLRIPFDPLLGGVLNPELVYPFTGTGFTATVKGRLVPELSLLDKERQPLPVGAELYQIDASGARRLRAVLGADRRWTRLELVGQSRCGGRAQSGLRGAQRGRVRPRGGNVEQGCSVEREEDTFSATQHVL